MDAQEVGIGRVGRDAFAFRDVYGSVHIGGRPAVPVRLLPAEAVSLEGRSELMQDLVGLLTRPGRYPRIVLTGPPGIGKTAIAACLATEPSIVQRFGNVLSASPAPDSNPEADLRRWAMALGLSGAVAGTDKRPQGGVGAAGDGCLQLRSAIAAELGRRGPTLIIIDGAWLKEHVRQFILDARECAYVITTRQMEIAKEATAGGHRKVKEISDHAVRRLLRMEAADAMDSDPIRATALVNALGGSPLATMLVAQQLKLESLIATTDRMREALDALKKSVDDGCLGEDPGRFGVEHTNAVSLSAAIATSIEQLGGDNSVLGAFYALSLFPSKPNSFDVNAFRAVTGEHDAVLEELVRRNLVEKTQGGRFTLHRVITNCAARHFESESWAQAKNNAEVRFAQHYLGRLAAGGKAAAVAQEYANLLSAFDFGVSQRVPGLHSAVKALLPVLERTALYSSGSFMKILQTAEEEIIERLGDGTSFTAPDVDDLVAVMLARGRSHMKVGENEAVEQVVQRLRDLEERVREPHRQSQLREFFADYYLTTADYRGVKRELNRLHKLLSLLPERERLLIELDRKYAEAELNLGHFASAEKRLEAARQSAIRCGNAEAVSGICLSLGVRAFVTGRYDEALGHLSQGLTWARQDNHPERIVAVLQMYAAAAHHKADREENTERRRALMRTSVRCIRDGLRQATLLRSNWYMCSLYNELAEYARKRKHFAAANRALKKGFECAAGLRDREGFLLLSAARLEYDRKDYQASRLRARDSLRRFTEAKHYMAAELRSFIRNLPPTSSEPLTGIVRPPGLSAWPLFKGSASESPEATAKPAGANPASGSAKEHA